jgi:hypothetical protein
MASNFRIDQFKTQLKNGGARPNQFQVRIGFPSYVQNDRQLLESSSFLVTVAELPGQTIGTTPVFYRGREVKLAGDKVFAPFQCTILNDTDFKLRNGIEEWMNGIENMGQKVGYTNPIAYMSSIDIMQLDRNGETLRAYKLLGAFPVDISPVGLDFSANDQLSTFTVSFQYQHFEYGLRAADSVATSTILPGIIPGGLVI